MTSPAECNDCGHCFPVSTCEEASHVCTNPNNRNKFVSAPICKTVGWFATADELRVEMMRANEEAMRRALLASRDNSLAAFARQALRGRG